jgi:hypothetical protein
MRRYSRFSGYAWAGAIGVGLVVWGGSKLGEQRGAAPAEGESRPKAT